MPTLGSSRGELDISAVLLTATSMPLSSRKILKPSASRQKHKQMRQPLCSQPSSETQCNLKAETDELVALSGVATDTKAAKDCAETELRRLRQAIASMKPTSQRMKP